ncbi:rod shape-determining protein MreD [Gammaproteobacteria bacterium 45_16_T64]|nr:rod shape-determining protein MreD [Gammaproteobacteria bacterium 45_16_T64]
MSRSEGSLAIAFTFVVAFIFAIMSLPGVLEYLRPEWVALIVIYWIIAIPHRVGVIIAWIVGIFHDVLVGAVLGQSALALSVIAYITFILHMRIRVFPIWQQCLSVLLLVGVYLLVMLMVERTVTTSHWTLWYWLPALSSAMVWPWIVLPLRWLRKSYAIN